MPKLRKSLVLLEETPIITVPPAAFEARLSAVSIPFPANAISGP
jgi:hypothetical protein